MNQPSPQPGSITAWTMPPGALPLPNGGWLIDKAARKTLPRMSDEGLRNMVRSGALVPPRKRPRRGVAWQDILIGLGLAGLLLLATDLFLWWITGKWLS